MCPLRGGYERPGFSVCVPPLITILCPRQEPVGPKLTPPLLILHWL